MQTLSDVIRSEPAAEPLRLVAADHPDRRLAAPATMAALMLRVDPTHELPIVVETEHGLLVARFRLAGDAAIFASVDRKTLPAPIVTALAAQERGQRAAFWSSQNRGPAPSQGEGDR
jgi:hypothetical protein